MHRLGSLMLLALCLHVNSVWAALTDPDLSFGGAGRAFMVGETGLPLAIAEDPQGGYYVLVYVSDGQARIHHFNADGEPLIGSGTLLAGLPPTAIALAIAVGTDGQHLYVAGTGGSSDPAAFVARYDLDFDLDTSFGRNDSGVARIPSQPPIVSLRAVEDGVLAGGSLNFIAPGFEGFIVKLTRRGRVDADFGADGFVTLSGHVPQAEVTALGDDGDATLVCGRSNSTGETYMVRVLPTGELDLDFGEGGVFSTDEFEGSHCLAARRQASGNIAIAVTDGSTVAVGRLTESGQLDDSFDVESGTITVLSVLPGIPLGIADSQGRLVLTDPSGPSINRYAGSTQLDADTTGPKVEITVRDLALKSGDVAAVKLTFDEPPVGLELADLVAESATLSDLTEVDATHWTAVLTPAADVTDESNVLSLADGSVTDDDGNPGVAAQSASYAVDTAAPTATLAVANTELSVGETTTVTIAFSEAPIKFTLADLTAQDASLSDLVATDEKTYQATLTAGTTPNAALVVSLSADTWKDTAGNNGTVASSNTYSVGISDEDRGGGGSFDRLALLVLLTLAGLRRALMGRT